MGTAVKAFGVQPLDKDGDGIFRLEDRRAEYDLLGLDVLGKTAQANVLCLYGFLLPHPLRDLHRHYTGVLSPRARARAKREKAIHTVLPLY